MTVNIQQVQVGFSNYMDAEIIVKAASWDKLKFGFVKAIILKQIPNMFNEYRNNPLFKDFVDSNGFINIDEFYSIAKSTIATTGQFVASGLIFNESDVDKLYNYIIKAQA